MKKVFYYIEFERRWPVGTSAVMVADNREQAVDILEDKLSNIGLTQSLKIDEMIEVDLSKSTAIILNDGDY